MTRRIIIVTDAWTPQINGVVTTLRGLKQELTDLGHKVNIIHPERFSTIPMPMYPEIRLALNPWKMKAMIEQFIGYTNETPVAFHIATEGPLGCYARNYCERRKIPYTTSYHTNFPEFIHEFTGLPAKWIYPFMRWMHKNAKSILVTTPTMKDRLAEHGFKNLVVWNRAVDTELFSPSKETSVYDQYARPIWLNVGRVSPEKNLGAFLDLELDGTKVIVGDGPALEDLQKQYEHDIEEDRLVFVGVKTGESLAEHFASADYFVFPSKTDTFGVVMIEAMASGLPVAAYPVTGPIDVIQKGVNGAMDEDLIRATDRIRWLDSAVIRQYVVENHTWDKFTQIFLETLVDINNG